MAASSFERLHQRRIAIEMDSGESSVRFCGTATYEPLSEIGPILRIQVADPAGDFDLILSEENWTGKIEKEPGSGCDFCITLTVSNLCPHS
jgi:hypothetical protein